MKAQHCVDDDESTGRLKLLKLLIRCYIFQLQQVQGFDLLFSHAQRIYSLAIKLCLFPCVYVFPFNEVCYVLYGRPI